MKDNEPIVILIILIILFGLAYEPIKNSSGGSGIWGGSNSNTYSSVGDQNSVGYSPNKPVGESLKEIEDEIKDLQKETSEIVGVKTRSPYYGKVQMSSLSGIWWNDPSFEYLTLYTNLEKTETVKITGWYLKSAVTGYYAIVGRADLLPFPYVKNESDVVLQQGDRVIITKGFSPIGISFRTNMCTGYFEENRTFTPNLPFNCPRPSDEKLPQFSSIHDREEECLDLIDRVSRCTTVTNRFIKDLPDTVTESCKSYLKNQINYNSCVANHFSDSDFPGNEYRIFLNKFGPLWRERSDIINLHDQNGLIVDTISY